MYDVIIVGGGAAGISAAQVLGRQRRRVLLVDGGHPRNRPADGIHMYLSRDGFPPLQLLEVGRDELAAYHSVDLHQGQVSTVAGEIDDFTVTLADATVHSARRLLLATGQVDEPWDIPGVPDRFGRSVFHCPFCHGWAARDKRIAVLGREPAQVMLAAYLADRYSDDVVVLTHGPHALPAEVVATLEALELPVMDQPVTELTGDLGALRLHLDDGTTVDCEVVFHRAPTRQHAPLATQLGVEMLPDGYVQVDEFAHTSVPGVAAAGDLARLSALPDGLTLVSQAAADGVRAAVWLEQGMFRASLPVPPG
ncbi:MAG: NAD(P)/FAD-dependent oxidoreductase [Phycicoccus sp.]